MVPPQVLLIGAQSVDKHGLMCRLAGLVVAPDQPTAPWRIDNKYYSADVQLRIAHLRPGGPAQDLEGSEEAVVLVFDADRHDTFTDLRQWWEGQAADPAIKLAVATGAVQQQEQQAAAVATGGSGEPARWLQYAQEWCAEQLIEYVEVPSQALEQAHSSNWASEQLPGQQHGLAEADEGGEAGGVMRILEALHAHMWPGLRLKPRGGSGDSTEAPSEAQSASSGGPPPEVATALAAAAQPAADGAMAPAANGLPNGLGNGLPNSLDIGEEQPEELDLLFAELAGARERLQEMGDSERRDAAAALMLRLMGALGLDEDAEDSEGEEGAREQAGERH